MKLVQNSKPEDKILAIDIRNHLVNGQFVIGNPALGLKKTLHKLETELEHTQDISAVDWQMSNGELIQKIAMTTAGIEGEEKLCDYLSRLVKYDDDLFGLVAFASLSYEQKFENLDYIPDTDVLLVYGKHVLILDAKNLKTSPYKEYRLEESCTVDDKDKLVLELHPSTHIWRNAFDVAGIEVESIDGYVCIINKTPTNIIRNEEWYNCDTKLIHANELRGILHEWTKNKDNTLYLNLLVEIAKAQIREDKSDMNFDPSAIKRRLGL